MEMEGDFFTSLPAGYRFKPKDEELVDYYLRRKIYNRPLPPNIFRDVDLYNYDPHTLTAMNDNASSNGVVTEWYFFTPRDRRHPNGKWPIRTAGDGCWKATGAAKPVVSRGEKIGTKRSLVFFRGKSSEGEKTDWLMHEYVLTKAPPRQRLSSQDMQLDDWVLCRVYKKKEQKTKPGTPVVAHTESEAQVLGDGISPDGLNTLMRQEAFGSMLGQNPASFDPQEAVSNNGNLIPMPTPLASMPPLQQFSDVNTSSDWLGLDTTQEEGDIGAVVGQGEVQMLGNGIAPIVQYQELQQQHVSGVDQSLQLQQYQPTGVDQSLQLQQYLLGVEHSQPLPQNQLSGVDRSLQLHQYQFSGFDQSQPLPQEQLLGLDTKQEGGDMSAVAGQSEVQMLGNGIAPIVQYQEFNAAGSLNMPMPQQQQQLLGVTQSQPLQQQQLSGVNQSLQLPEQQFSGVNPSNDWFYLDTTQDEDGIGPVAGQSVVQMLGNEIAPISQYQQFDAGSLNMPMPQQQQQLSVVYQSQPLQQQQPTGVDQSRQLQHQQFSGVDASNLDFTVDEEFLLDFTAYDELGLFLDF